MRASSSSILTSTAALRKPSRAIPGRPCSMSRNSLAASKGPREDTFHCWIISSRRWPPRCKPAPTAWPRAIDFMSEFFSVMTWPLLACLLLPGMLVYLGLHIVKREIIFVDLALAQVAALGASVGILMHYEPMTWQSYCLSLGFTLVGAAVFTLTRTENHHLAQEVSISTAYDDSV